MEIMLVVALVALLSGAAVLKLTGSLRSATLEDSVRRLIELNELVRSHSRNAGVNSDIVFSIEGGKVFYREDGQSAELARISLGGCKLLSLMTARETTSGGECQIRCSSLGYTPSYCIGLQDPSGQRKWICVAGLSGQAVVFYDEAAAKVFFEPVLPSQSGDDAR
jgi:type II secretory pathway pseudopilin PulG